MREQVYNGVYRGVVESVDDPLNLGRCRIRVPSIHGSLKPSEINLLPWARYISPLPTGLDKGMFIPPEVNDVVCVVFEGGNKLYPMYIGSIFGISNGTNEVPIDPEEDYRTTDVVYKSRDISGVKSLIKRTKDSFILSMGDSYLKFNLNGDIDIHSAGNINSTQGVTDEPSFSVSYLSDEVIYFDNLDNIILFN